MTFRAQLSNSDSAHHTRPRGRRARRPNEDRSSRRFALPRGRRLSAATVARPRSVASMGLAALLLMPAVLAVPPSQASQPLLAPRAAAGQSSAVAQAAGQEVSPRDPYEVISRAELLRQRFAMTYTTTWSGPVRWPFPTPVPISSGFGYRAAPCSGCSTDHRATDFAPGGGVPIYAIAAGVVKKHVDGTASWGNFVVIEHQIDGRTVTSSYAHMQSGSSALVEGQQVAVGAYVGLVGSTGQATGKHLHLEIQVDGVKVDPYLWLTENAG